MPGVQAPTHRQAAFLQGVRDRTGINRICPQCHKPTFLVAESKEQEDGSTRRERRCKSCGHVEERIAPPEKPVG